MNDTQRFLMAVAGKYELSFPDVYERAVYLLADVMPEGLLAVITEHLEEEKSEKE
jgi:hypothetical protein